MTMMAGRVMKWLDQYPLPKGIRLDYTSSALWVERNGTRLALIVRERWWDPGFATLDDNAMALAHELAKEVAKWIRRDRD